MKEVMVMMIGLLISSKVSSIMEESKKESFTKEEITNMLAEACTEAIQGMSKVKE